MDARVRTPTPLATVLSVIFFLSGAASLLFETLWFRLSGLVFGNSSWASAIVLASFMAGLAIGNLLSTRLVGRFDRPLRVYAALEVFTGIAGLILVLVLPRLPAMLAPLFRLFLDAPLLHAARLACAFVLLLIPATMMGATLPSIVSALSRHDANFGRVLGLLYGCNTIGAVAGTLAGELLLIRVAGVQGTGAIAALCSIAAGGAACFVRSPLPAPSRRAGEGGGEGLPWRLLFAAAASGFALLALEVIWFRVAILFVLSTTLAFAVMLAVILAGIGIGALIASAVMSRFPDADSYAPVVAAASTAALVLSYSGFTPFLGGSMAVLVDSVRLMLPVSILSGVLFTLIGRAVARVVGDDTRATAMVTFANTIGAAAGPIVAGFALIPSIGVEASFFAVAVLYAAVAVLLIRSDVPRLALAAAGSMAALTLFLFPFHLMENDLLPKAMRYYRDSRVVAIREGPTETAVVLRKDYAGEPYVHRLFTNGFSMSATTFASKRYMSAFVYLPLALRPNARSALLISYGVGVTAKRLTEARQIASIDVVDISKDILDLSSIVWPGKENPLADPRARVHVEDGRFFLLTTPRRFDLITGEPPPPKCAGIVNLYTREYFQLVRDRLTADGIASYWLPVYQLSEPESKAIIRAFCDAFDDCSVWSGAGAEWILIGSRGQPAAPVYADFARQWRDSISGPQMIRLGFESPEQIAATFIADAAALRSLTAGSAPLTDDFPLRLGTRPVQAIPPMALALMDRAAGSFAQSAFARAALPVEVRSAAAAYFGPQRMLDGELLLPIGSTRPPAVPLLRSLLTSTSLRTLPRVLFGTDAWLEEIALRARARGDRDPSLAYIAAIGALSDRQYPRAQELFAEARRGLPGERELADYQALAASLAGEHAYTSGHGPSRSLLRRGAAHPEGPIQQHRGVAP